jgi:hypothetical protein
MERMSGRVGSVGGMRGAGHAARVAWLARTLGAGDGSIHLVGK